MIKSSTLHIFAILFIYIPAAAIIPVGFVISFWDWRLSMAFVALCAVIIFFAYRIKPRLAARLGVSDTPHS